jgi:hypothetical protein
MDTFMSLPMRTEEELIIEIEHRNKARAEAGLPLVSVEQELAKISQAESRQHFCDSYKANPILRAKVAEVVLATFREERGDLSWVPRGYLNGAGAYGACLRERMRQIWEEERMRLRD